MKSLNRPWSSWQDQIRRERVVALMRAASSPRLSIRRDPEVEYDDETGKKYHYDHIEVRDGRGRCLMPFTSEDQLDEFCQRVALLRRRHAVIS